MKRVMQGLAGAALAGMLGGCGDDLAGGAGGAVGTAGSSSGGMGATGTGGAGAGGGMGASSNGGSGGASGTNYFNWDVESDTTSLGDVLGYFGATTRDCTVAHRGACSMKLVVIGDDSGNQGLGADLPSWTYYPFPFIGGPSLYYRWWMRIEPGFSWGNGTAKTKSSRTGENPMNGGTMAQGYTGYLMDYGFLIGECDSAGCALSDGSSNGSDSSLYVPYDFTSVDDGAWHEYIVRVKPNTSASCQAGVDCDAELEAWVDGASVGAYTEFKLHGTDGYNLIEGWGGWMVKPYFQLNGTATDGGTIYVDDFSTDDAYNSMIP